MSQLTFAEAGAVAVADPRRQVARAGGDLDHPPAARCPMCRRSRRPRASRFRSGVLARAERPANTPEEIVDRLHAEMKRIMATPELQHAGRSLGPASPSRSPPIAESQRYIKSEIEKWGGLVEEPRPRRDDLDCSARPAPPLPSRRVAGLQTPPNRLIAGAIDLPWRPDNHLPSRGDQPRASILWPRRAADPGAAGGRHRAGAAGGRCGGRAGAARPATTSAPC